MELNSSLRAIRRARKAFRHATNALESATTDKARSRHARRAACARRAMAEAERDFAQMALTEA